MDSGVELESETTSRLEATRDLDFLLIKKPFLAVQGVISLMVLDVRSCGTLDSGKTSQLGLACCGRSNYSYECLLHEADYPLRSGICGKTAPKGYD